MTPQEFKEIRKATGISFSEIARLSHVKFRTVQRWANGYSAIPEAIAEWLRALKPEGGK